VEAITIARAVATIVIVQLVPASMPPILGTVTLATTMAAVAASSFFPPKIAVLLWSLIIAAPAWTLAMAGTLEAALSIVSKRSIQSLTTSTSNNSRKNQRKMTSCLKMILIMYLLMRLHTRSSKRTIIVMLKKSILRLLKRGKSTRKITRSTIVATVTRVEMHPLLVTAITPTTLVLGVEPRRLHSGERVHTVK